MKKIITAVSLLLVCILLAACADREAAKAATEAIDAIGAVGKNSGAAIASAESLVNALDDETLAKVKNVDVLRDSREKYDSICAEYVDKLINNALGGSSGSSAAPSTSGGTVTHNAKTYEKKTSSYADVRKEYEALEDGAKAKVKSYEKLVAAEKALADEGDAWVSETEALIKALTPVTLSSEDAINKAREAIAAMPQELAARLTNADGPDKAAAELKALRVKTVEDAITAIGEVALGKEDTITNARKVYDSAADDIKTSVSNYSALMAAEQKIIELRINNVTDAINNLGEITLDSEEAINNATALYNALSKTERAGVTNYSTLTAAKKTLSELKQAEKDKIDIEEAKKVIRVKSVSIGSHDSVGGAYLYFNFVNMSDKVFKYVNFTVRFKNNVGDWASDEITGSSSSSCYYTGPVNPGEGTKSGWHWGKYYGWDITQAELTSLSIDFMDGTHMYFNSKQIEAVQY